MASIQKRPNGQWRARYRDEAGKEHARHFQRKVDAQQWLDEVTASVVTGTYADPRQGRVTFGAYSKSWAERQVWESTTRRSFAYSVKDVPFENVPMARIRASHLEQWVKRMRASGLAASTIQTRFANVHGVFHAAIRDRVIGVDPAEGVKLPRVPKAEHAKTIPTPEQLGQVLAHLSTGEPGDRADRAVLRALIALGAFAGLRPAEAIAVQVGDVDFLGRTIHVARQVQFHRGEMEIRPPKYESVRTVYVPSELTEILAPYAEGKEPGDWLFVGSTVGGVVRPVHPKSTGERWSRVRKRLGLPRIVMHDWRHYYASGLIAAGCDVVTVQRALGHSSATITLDTYSHLWPTAEDRTRKAAAAMAAAALAPADSVRTEEVR